MIDGLQTVILVLLEGLRASRRVLGCVVLLALGLFMLLGCEPIDPFGHGGISPPVGNRAPVPRINILPANPTVGVEVTFDGSKSFDPDGDRPLQYRWDIYWGTTHMTVAVCTFTDKRWESGTYKAVLTVSDPYGLQARATQYVEIGSRIVSQDSCEPMPSERLGFDWKTSGDEDGLTVIFDGRANEGHCGLGEPTYAWEFGDGSWGTGAVVTHQYAKPGVYTITMQVECRGGTLESLQAPLSVGFTQESSLPGVGFVGPFEVAAESPESEYVTLMNFSSDPVLMSGWEVESSSGYHFWFPTGYELRPGQSVGIYSGYGTGTDNELFWCSDFLIWPDREGFAILRDRSGKVVDRANY